jgi:hypothetical protein
LCALLAERNQFLSRSDLLLHGSGIDGCNDYVGRQRPPGRLELKRLLLDLSLEGPVRKECSTEEIERIGCVRLRDEDVLDEGLLGKNGNSQRSLPRRAELEIDLWKEVVADLRAQLFPGSLQVLRAAASDGLFLSPSSTSALRSSDPYEVHQLGTGRAPITTCWATPSACAV